MGFDAFFFGRIDYQDHNIRNATQQLEFIWEPSSSLGSGVNIFTHVLWSDYCYPSGILPHLTFSLNFLFLFF